LTSSRSVDSVAAFLASTWPTPGISIKTGDAIDYFSLEKCAYKYFSLHVFIGDKVWPNNKLKNKIH